MQHTASVMEKRDRSGPREAELPICECQVCIDECLSSEVRKEAKKLIQESSLAAKERRQQVVNKFRKDGWPKYDIDYDAKEFQCPKCDGNCIRRRMCCSDGCKLLMFDKKTKIIWIECKSRDKLVGLFFECEKQLDKSGWKEIKTNPSRGRTYVGEILSVHEKMIPISFNLYGCTKMYCSRMFDADNSAMSDIETVSEPESEKSSDVDDGDDVDVGDDDGDDYDE